MYKILTLNNIAIKGLEKLPRDNYEVASEIQNPDAILLRSFKMHDMEVPASLKAIGRAGAGVNNIPVDKCTEKIVESVLRNNYTGIIIADHGNSETMINEDGSPNTAHTTNPVPVILVDKELKTIKDGILANIAPTVLDLIGIEKPAIMNEVSLIQ